MDTRAARAHGPGERGDITRIVNHSGVMVAGCVYTHANLTSYEGRRVVLRRVGDDLRQLRVFVEERRTGHAGEEIAAVVAVVDQASLRDIIGRDRPESSR